MEIVARKQLFAKFSPVYLETSPFIPSDFELVLQCRDNDEAKASVYD